MALAVLSVVLYNKISTKKTVTQTKSAQIQFNQKSYAPYSFSDGLKNPESVQKYNLDEFEIGVGEKSVYVTDINNDGKPDKIVKTFFENGNAHSYYKYAVALNKDDKYINIAPNNLQTTNGADCDLRQIQFEFKPKFQITVIYREMGDTWDEPTMAYKQIFTLQNDKLVASQPTKIRPICDVKRLF